MDGILKRRDIQVDELLTVLLRVADVLKSLHVPFMVGGSVASSRYGEIRTTNDVDLVADISLQHVEPFVAALQGEFYVDAEMIRDAVLTRESFNVIHLETAQKIDVFIPKADKWNRNQLERRQEVPIVQADIIYQLPFASAEDVILHKLLWFRLGGEVSERQWRDVRGVLRVQAQGLDFDYLKEWASVLGVSDLLERALNEVEM